MRKILLYLTLCLSSLCWGQEVDVLGDWKAWNKVAGEQLQSELPLEEYMPTSDQSDLIQNAMGKSEGAPEQSIIFGVGLIGIDEQQLNVLDGSSLMDYEQSPSDSVDQKGDIFDGHFFIEGGILDSFDEGAELTSEQFYGVDEVGVKDDSKSIEALEYSDESNSSDEFDETPHPAG